MKAPCVRVAREAGERTRKELAESDLIDRDLDIDVEDGFVYIPVTDPTDVPDRYDVVEHEVEPRDTQTMPADLLGFEPTYERLGDVAIVGEDDPERARAIADAIVESDLPLERVANRASKVKGEERVRDWERLVGDGLEVIHREYGCTFALDLERVYFSPRLATERHRVVEQVTEGERVLDMFAGVGPFAIPMAKRGAEVVGVDVNPDAIDYLRENSERNGVSDRLTAIEGDVREVAREYVDWADRIVMNLPHSADEFLETAFAIAREECVLHYYDIQHEADPFGPGTRAIREVAEGAEYDVEVETEHVVRSYAPHELNVCLDVRVTRRRDGDRNP